MTTGADDVRERLAAIAEELGDLALERLRAVADQGGDDGADDAEANDRRAAALAEERRVTRARRAVEKAVDLLATHPRESFD